MHDSYRRFAITIAAAIKHSREARERIVEALNKKETNTLDGIVALLVLAAGHAKESNLGRDEFVYMCGELYDTTTMNREGGDDVIVLPENQNN